MPNGGTRGGPGARVPEGFVKGAVRRDVSDEATLDPSSPLGFRRRHAPMERGTACSTVFWQRFQEKIYKDVSRAWNSHNHVGRNLSRNLHKDVSCASKCHSYIGHTVHVNRYTDLSCASKWLCGPFYSYGICSGF